MQGRATEKDTVKFGGSSIQMFSTLITTIETERGNKKKDARMVRPND